MTITRLGARPATWGLVLLSVVALVASLLPMASASAEVVTTDASGTIEVVHTTPSKAGIVDDGVVDKLVELTDLAAGGSEINASFFRRFESQALTDALEDAADRGVTVEIVHEVCGSGCKDLDASPLMADLAAYPGITVTNCNGACDDNRPQLSINHNKFMLFSELSDGRDNVVANGSQNMTPHQNTVHNNFLISYDDASFYDGFRAYWQALHDHTAAPGSPAVQTVATRADGRLAAYFSPRVNTGTASDDMFATLINEVDCSRPGGVIRVQSATWWKNRSYVRGALLAQKAAGCSVILLMDDGDTSTSQYRENQEYFADAGILVYGFAPGGCHDVVDVDHVIKNRCINTYGGTHQKYVLVEGRDASNTPIELVMSGSQNFTRQAIYNGNDTTVRIDDAAIYQGYLDDFEREIAECVKIDPARYPDGALRTVNAAGFGSQDRPDVDSNDSGYTAVVWSDTYNPTQVPAPRHGAIWIAMYHNGAKIFEKAVQSGGTADYDYKRPMVGVDAQGNSIVAWQDDADGNGSYNIAFRPVSNAGIVGSRTVANGATAHQQTSPSLDVDSSGAFSISWTDTSSGDSRAVLAVFDASGAKQFETTASSSSAGGEASSGVARDESGRSIVVWRDDADQNGSGEIKVRAFNATGTARWGTKTVNSASYGDQATPAVAATPDGDFVVAWRDGRQTIASAQAPRIYVKGYDIAGATRFADTVVSTHAYDTGDNITIGAQYHPDIAVDSLGNFVVAWHEHTPFHSGQDVYAKSYGDDGTVAAASLAEYRMNVRTSYDQSRPAVGVDSDTGLLSLVYTGDSDGNGSAELRMREGFPIR